jgi:hypothetical protein
MDRRWADGRWGAGCSAASRPGLAQRKASSALGVPVTLENFSVDVPALQVDLYGLTIDGAAPYPTPPLLQVNHIEASARIISLFHLKWYLNRVQVDHPVVYVIENRRGRSNLPVARGGTGKSNVDLFSLAIRHAVLDGGEIYVNDRPQTLDARLTDLEMSAEYHTLAHAYAGTSLSWPGCIVYVQFGHFSSQPGDGNERKLADCGGGRCNEFQPARSSCAIRRHH